MYDLSDIHNRGVCIIQLSLTVILFELTGCRFCGPCRGSFCNQQSHRESSHSGNQWYESISKTQNHDIPVFTLTTKSYILCSVLEKGIVYYINLCTLFTPSPLQQSQFAVCWKSCMTFDCIFNFQNKIVGSEQISNMISQPKTNKLYFQSQKLRARFVTVGVDIRQLFLLSSYFS